MVASQEFCMKKKEKSNFLVDILSQLLYSAFVSISVYYLHAWFAVLVVILSNTSIGKFKISAHPLKNGEHYHITTL